MSKSRRAPCGGGMKVISVHDANFAGKGLAACLRYRGAGAIQLVTLQCYALQRFCMCCMCCVHALCVMCRQHCGSVQPMALS